MLFRSAACERDDLVDFHFSLGMSIRNIWIYPEEAVLRQRFLETGIFHADDMSSIIIHALWLDLNGVELSHKTLSTIPEWRVNRGPNPTDKRTKIQDLIGNRQPYGNSQVEVSA